MYVCFSINCSITIDYDAICVCLAYFFNIVFIERIFALPFAHLFVTLATLKVLSFFLRFATKASPSSPSAEMKSKKLFFILQFSLLFVPLTFVEGTIARE